MNYEFEHMDIPESVRNSVLEVEQYFNARTLGTWEYMGLADRRLVCQLREELNLAKQRIKELESEGDRAIEFAMQGSKTCSDAVWFRVRNKS